MVPNEEYKDLGEILVYNDSLILFPHKAVQMQVNLIEKGFLQPVQADHTLFVLRSLSKLLLLPLQD